MKPRQGSFAVGLDKTVDVLLRKTRNVALDEAAQCCVAFEMIAEMAGDKIAASAAHECAYMIRKLKEPAK